VFSLTQPHPGPDCHARTTPRMSRVRAAAITLGAALSTLALAAPGAQAAYEPPTLGCATGAVAVVAWPAACKRPYAATSPFNRPIPANPRLSPRSAAMVSWVTGLGPPNNLVAGTADTTLDWGHPTYYSTASDPLFTLKCTEPWGRCMVAGMQIRIPDAARAAGGSDRHMTIVDPSGWEYDLWDVSSKPVGGGILKFAWGGRTRIDGDGRNSDATASRFGNLAGMIRAQEMQAGRIDHALFMTIDCDNGGFVYPATKNSRICAAPTNAAPMGSRFQLNMTAAEINALAVPAWKKTILRAMAEYGMYFGDGGSRTWGLMFESGSTFTSFGYKDAMETFGAANKVPMWQGDYVFDLKTGVNYAGRLRVLDPCVAQATC